MKISDKINIWDIHNCLIITFILLLILQLGIFGFWGLIVYWIIFLYAIACIIINGKSKHFCKSIVFYSGIVYYIIALLAPLINGGFTRIGTHIAQLFAILLLCFINRETDELENDIISISKIMITAGFIVCTMSLILSISVTFFPECINSLPSKISNYINKRSGSLFGRINGLAGNANSTACFCYIGAVFSIYLIFNKPNKTWKVLSISNICLSAYIIFIATASRTNMLSFISFSIVFITSYYLVAQRKRNDYKKTFYKILFVTVVLIILFILLLLVIPSFRNYVLTKIVRVSSLSDGSNRLTVYKTAWSYGKGNRILGFNNRKFYDQTGFSHTHNAFLEVLSFSGLFGLIPFLFFSFTSIFYAIKNLIIYSKTHNNKLKTMVCFFVAFMAGYVFNALIENGTINRLGPPMFAVLQIVIGYTSQIFYNYIRKYGNKTLKE